MAYEQGTASLFSLGVLLIQIYASDSQSVVRSKGVKLGHQNGTSRGKIKSHIDGLQTFSICLNSKLKYKKITGMIIVSCKHLKLNHNQFARYELLKVCSIRLNQAVFTT